MAPSTKSCKVCSLPFGNETELKKHLLTHFICEICSTPFDEQKYLTRYIKTHHTVMNCEICGLECSDRDSFM